MIKLKTMAMEVAFTSFFHKKIIHEDNTYEKQPTFRHATTGFPAK